MFAQSVFRLALQLQRIQRRNESAPRQGAGERPRIVHLREAGQSITLQSSDAFFVRFNKSDFVAISETFFLTTLWGYGISLGRPGALGK
jgi:hypothetical protein